jgi:2,3-bisphosphoglycerate-independent phosphoglycerate mutase
MKEKVSIAVLPDHATPCDVRTHTHDPVPFIIYNPDIIPDQVMQYNEKTTEKGYFGILEKDQFIKTLFELRR